MCIHHLDFETMVCAVVKGTFIKSSAGYLCFDLPVSP